MSEGAVRFVPSQLAEECWADIYAIFVGDLGRSGEVMARVEAMNVDCIEIIQKHLDIAREEGVSMNPMQTHNLKTWPVPFKALWDGVKKHEYRENDRDYKNGDILVLQEYDPDEKKYSGRTIRAQVTYIDYGPDWKISDGCCVMTIDVLDTKEG